MLTPEDIFFLTQVSFLDEETGSPRENHRPAASHLQTLSHNYLFV